MPRQGIIMRATLAVISFTVFLVAATLPAEEQTRNVFGQCILPLGMEEGRIPDDAITASSSYEMKSVGPQNARIRQEKNGGAWCPKAQISSAIREYLEVDLTRNHLIAWTETQGRFGNGQGQEYAEAFFLDYWRDASWHQYKNLKGERVRVKGNHGHRVVLRGNSNTYLVEKQKLELPFVASRVRFIPYSQHPRTVCMRVEIYGCVWDQHVARYAAPKPWSVGPEGCNVEDSSYDGTELEGLIVNGLGQLTDGILGEDSEILRYSERKESGSNWVGWTDQEAVEFIFEFQDLREFNNCSIHMAHLPELEIEASSVLYVWFSLDGEDYQSDPEKLELSTEPLDGKLIVSSTGSVSISLQSRIGRFVKLELRTNSKWLLISEISFETVAGTRNLSTDGTIASERSLRAYRNQSESQPDSTSEKSVSGFNETIDEVNEEDSTPDAFPVGTSQTYIGLVSGLLTVLALILSCTAFLMKQRGRNKVALLQKHTALLCGTAGPGITINTINAKDVKLPNPLVVNGLTLGCRTPASSCPESRRNSRPLGGHDCEHSTVYERTYKLFSDEDLKRDEAGSSNCKSDYSDIKSNANFVKEKITESTMPTTFPSKKTNHLQSAKHNQKVHEGYYAATDILTIKRREQSSVLSLFTPLHIRENNGRLPRILEPYDIQRISRHRLRILDKLGEGSFGLVHMCEAKGIPNPELGSIQNRQIVIVRSLWRGVVDSLRIDFTKDMYVLATLRDPNIAKIIALVEEEPFGAVFEYGQFGDLPTFLESHESCSSSNEITLSYGYLLNFSTQIASGMKYLESVNIPHCDLAARNCIVGPGLTIKVSDHAMYCSKYDHHYYVDGCYAKIPLRWMAWEAVLLSKRTCQADVWSFAVTVWEILTSCKEIPYSELTAEQVLENCSRWYQGGAGGANNERNHPRTLSRPSSCPDDLYRVMTKCWSKQVEDRPTFEELYLYLKRLGLD